MKERGIDRNWVGYSHGSSGIRPFSVKWRAGQNAERNLGFANSRFVVSIWTEEHLGIIRAVTGLIETSRLVIGILLYQAS